MNKIFLSHSSQDDGFIRELQQALGDLQQDVWIDSRQLRGGDLLWPDIQKGIDDSSAYAVLVSSDGLQSKWIGKELKYALKLQEKRGQEQFPVIPLSLNGTKLGVLEEFFDKEPLYIPVSSAAGGIDAALNAILVAMGKRPPADVPATPQPKAEPLEELVLVLTDMKFHEQDGVRCASARSRLVYEPAMPGQPYVHSAASWRFFAPLGPIEKEELRWYLEKYAIWPSEYFRNRARRVEESLVEWGKLLHEAAMPAAHTGNVMRAWEKVVDHAGRRFSVHVDSTLEAGAANADVKVAREAATLLLGLPWELLHDGDGFLFQGAKPTRVRRRLPNTRSLDVPVFATPIRILLVTARPEDDACGYIDHRASALPLVEAMEELGGLVRLHVLNPPTLSELSEELDRARFARRPYHVVHFDGHGAYDCHVGLGGLCFENPEDTAKLDKRRHVTVFSSDLGPLLRDHRIPLVFLEACQTAQAEKASESVASELLKIGVASVVAMSHSVLVETARRFAEAFYHKLAVGGRVGDAMLAGQRTLNVNKSRGRALGAGELMLHDWFVPVLFQEKDDPQLFRTIPAKQTRADLKTALATRLGQLPAEPSTGFIGRSRELLALERLLRHERYAVVRGQGGDGKTVLAAELARWMVRSQQVRRAAFVSVETHSNVQAVLDALGRQLVLGYSAGTFGDLEKAILPVERALIEQSTLLIVDNMESILLPPFLETPVALLEEARSELEAILQLCARLNALGETRLVFTSRESLPAPFDAERHRRELTRLDREDAVKLVERVLNDECDQVAGNSLPGDVTDAACESIEQLVDAVHGHARTLALLAPSLRSQGVEATRDALVELMAEMERQFPGSREKSVFASVELSLRRMSPANQERACVLGEFHGTVQLDTLRAMMDWEQTDVGSLASELIETGLATPNRYNHLSLNPALCPYLRGKVTTDQSETQTTRWGEAMRGLVEYLKEHQGQHSELVATLTVLELPNLFALLDQMQRAGDSEATIKLTTSLHILLLKLGMPRLLQRVEKARDASVAVLDDAVSHARITAEVTRIQTQLAGGRLHEAHNGAQQLLQCARAAGEHAYPGADFDLAQACFVLAQVLKTSGGSQQALPLFDEACQRFESAERARPGCGAGIMVSRCSGQRGDCFRNLGRLSEAASAWEESIRMAEEVGDERDIAVGKGQLGTVRLYQRQFKEALMAYAEAREWYTRRNEPGSVALCWHQAGMAHQQAGQQEAAEDAYRNSLAIAVQLGDVALQARTLNHLGLLYCNLGLMRAEEALILYRQAAQKFGELGDQANVNCVRNNLASALRTLRRLDEARREILQVIENKKRFGHAAEPWLSWEILIGIEKDAGNPMAVADAKSQAIACYLEYRRVGGENHDGPGRICLDVTQSLLAGNPAEVSFLIQHYLANPAAAWIHPFLQALQAIVTGSRDRTLADAPDLDYKMAADILFLIEKLEQPY